MSNNCTSICSFTNWNWLLLELKNINKNSDNNKFKQDVIKAIILYNLDSEYENFRFTRLWSKPAIMKIPTRGVISKSDNKSFVFLNKSSLQILILW